MKRYLKHFDLSLDFVTYSVYDCLDGTTSGKQRWTRHDTACFIAEYYKKWMLDRGFDVPSDDVLIENIRWLARNQRYKLLPIVNWICREIYYEIKNKTLEFPPIVYSDRYDNVAKKMRRIGISSMKQQCCDYIAVNACKKMLNSKIGHYQCASLKRKGQLFGKQAIETWIRTNPKKCRYVWKGDVRKFYPSVDHDMLKGLIDRDVVNEDVKYLISTLIDTYEQGLCIGSYLCQYLANYILSYAYHYVTEMLYVERRGKRIKLVNHALFYMDDLLLIGSNKKNVKMAYKMLEKYLNEKLLLTLKPTYQLFPLDSRPIDMMGYKIWTYKTTVRRRIFNNANKVFVRFKNPNNEMTLHDAQKIVSYYGYFKHSYSYKYFKKVKLDITLNKAKEMISNASKCNV